MLNENQDNKRNLNSNWDNVNIANSHSHEYLVSIPTDSQGWILPHEVPHVWKYWIECGCPGSYASKLTVHIFFEKCCQREGVTDSNIK